MIIPRKLHGLLLLRLEVSKSISTSQLNASEGILISTGEKDPLAHLDEPSVIRVDKVDIDLFSLILFLA